MEAKGAERQQNPALYSKLGGGQRTSHHVADGDEAGVLPAGEVTQQLPLEEAVPVADGVVLEKGGKTPPTYSSLKPAVMCQPCHSHARPLPTAAGDVNFHFRPRSSSSSRDGLGWERRGPCQLHPGKGSSSRRSPRHVGVC